MNKMAWRLSGWSDCPCREPRVGPMKCTQFDYGLRGIRERAFDSEKQDQHSEGLSSRSRVGGTPSAGVG